MSNAGLLTVTAPHAGDGQNPAHGTAAVKVTPLSVRGTAGEAFVDPRRTLDQVAHHLRSPRPIDKFAFGEQRDIPCTDAPT